MNVVDLSSPVHDSSSKEGLTGLTKKTKSPKQKKSSNINLAKSLTEELRQFKKATRDSAKIKMLIDIAKLETSLKDCIETVFFDVTLDNGETADKRGYFAKKCDVPGLIRWTHMTNDNLSKNNAIPAEFVEPFALIVVNPEDFLNKLLLSADGIDFERLGAYVDSTRNVIYNGLCPVGSSLIVVLLDLDKAMLKIQKKLSKVASANGTASRNITALVDSATAYLVYEHDVELVRWKAVDEFAEYLTTLCKVITERTQEPVTEIDNLERFSKRKPEASMSLKDTEKFELRETWAAMLQTIPQLSKTKAQAVVANPDYSSFRKTFRRLNDEAVLVSSREELMSSSFGQGKSKVARNQNKLSKQVFRSLTVTDPECCF